jgi:O-Antigen ligase
MTLSRLRLVPNDLLPWLRREGGLLATGLLAFSVFLIWEWRDGGYATTDWLPGGLFLAFLLAIALITVPGTTRPPRAIGASIVCLFVYTLWNACSIIWAGQQGIAWDGTNRTLVYLCVFALFGILRWPRRTVAFLLGAFVLGTAVLGALAFFRATAVTPYDAFVDGRLGVPIGYSNGDAGMFLAALWPGLYLAARRETHPAARGLMLAAVGVLVDLSILSQSRASIVAVPAVAIVFLILVPSRLRIVVAALPVIIVATLTAPTLIHTYLAVLNEHGAASAVSHSRSVFVETVLVLFFVGLLLGMLDRSVILPRRLMRSIRATLLTAALVLGAVALIGIGAVGHPIAHVSSAWSEFKADDDNDFAHPHLVSGFGSSRYDIWRVALIEFRDHPIAGIGSDNFLADYMKLRRTSQEPLYPHGLLFRVLSQTGVVGAVLLFGWLGLSFFAFFRGRRTRSRDAHGLACSAFALTLYWLTQGMVDWFWELPALGAPAVACLALSMRVTDDDALPGGGRLSGRRIGAVAAIAIVPMLSLLFPWLAAREVAIAGATWYENPDRAFARLALARRLNPLSSDADAVAGVVARRLGETAREQGAERRVLARDPSNWYAWLEISLADAREHHDRDAIDAVRRARLLDPREPVLVLVEKDIADGKRLDDASIEQYLANRLTAITPGRGSAH